MGYDWAVLEVANDCVGEDDDNDEDDDDKEYGSYGYYQGKKSQGRLFCNYERYGFREDSKLNTTYKYFSDDSFPAMKINLNGYSQDCLAKIAFLTTNPISYNGTPSDFCKKLGHNGENIQFIKECTKDLK